MIVSFQPMFTLYIYLTSPINHVYLSRMSRKEELITKWFFMHIKMIYIYMVFALVVVGNNRNTGICLSKKNNQNPTQAKIKNKNI